MNRFFVGALFFVSVMVVAQSAPSQIVFTSESRTIAVGAVSGTLTVQAQDANGNAFKLPATGCLALSSSLAGEFSSSAESWNAVSVLTMNKNSANRNFYYKGNTAGLHTLTARLVLKPESETRSCANWPVAEWLVGWSTSQEIVVGGSGGVSEPRGEEEGGRNISTPVQPQSAPVPSLTVQISAPATAWAGADAEFSATVFGEKKEPIANSRVVWNFGNGASREGRTVRFAYNIPGSYLVLVSASSGGLSGTARKTVLVRAPALALVRATPGPEGFIEIENKSGVELDVSGWILQSGALSFVLPQSSVMLPKTTVAYPASVTGVFVAEGDAQILFPNGKVAAGYEKVEVIAPVPAQNPPPNPPPLEKEGGERGGFISTTSTPASAILSTDDVLSRDITPWLWATVGIGLLGIAGLAAFRFRPLEKDERTDEAKFADKVKMV